MDNLYFVYVTECKFYLKKQINIELELMIYMLQGLVVTYTDCFNLLQNASKIRWRERWIDSDKVNTAQC